MKGACSPWYSRVTVTVTISIGLSLLTACHEPQPRNAGWENKFSDDVMKEVTKLRMAPAVIHHDWIRVLGDANHSGPWYLWSSLPGMNFIKTNIGPSGDLFVGTVPNSIVVSGLDGKIHWEAVPPSGTITAVALSQEGSEAVFQSRGTSVDGRFSIYRLGSQDRNPKKLVEFARQKMAGSAGYEDPQSIGWSVDRKHIAYSDGAAIWSYSTESGITSFVRAGTDPTYSPDGSQIALRNGRGEIEVVKNSVAVTVISGFQVTSAARWSPDSKLIVCVLEYYYPNVRTAVSGEAIARIAVLRLRDRAMYVLPGALHGADANDLGWVHLEKLGTPDR